jgi:hypothetical protein
MTANGPSWAAEGMAQAYATEQERDGNDPRREPADELGDVTEIRLVAGHEAPGGLYVLVMGTGPAPLLSYAVQPEFVDELRRRGGSNAIVRCRVGQPGPSLVTPPGELPAFFRLALPARVCGCEDDGCGGDCAGSRRAG